MKVSELITHLSNLKEEHGDLEVRKVHFDTLQKEIEPLIAFGDKFYNEEMLWSREEGEDRKGEKVISI